MNKYFKKVIKKCKLLAHFRNIDFARKNENKIRTLLGFCLIRALFWVITRQVVVEVSWNVMAHGDAQEGKWSGNWRMEWVAITLHTTSEHGVSSITTADGYTSATSSRLNWRPRRFKWARPFFAERRNLISAHVPSHFNWSLIPFRRFGTTYRPHLQGSRTRNVFKKMLLLAA